MDAGRTLYLGGIPAAHASQEGVRAVLAQHGAGACLAVGLQAQEAASDAATGGSYTDNNTDNHADTSSRCVDRLDGTHRGVRSRLAWFARGILSVVTAVWFTNEQ